MADNYKVLGQSNPSAATLTTLYTVPASHEAITSTLIICNRSSTTTTVRVAIRPAGAGISDEHYIIYDLEVPGGDPYMATIGITLEATDVVSVYAALATVSFNLLGNERDA